MTPTLPADGRQRLLLVLAGAIVALLFYLGGKPFAAGLIPAPLDKLAHFAAYGTIAALLHFGSGGRHHWPLLLFVGVVGGVDEWQQRSVPGRSADLADLATDLIAAASAIAACTYWTTRRTSKDAAPGLSG